MKKLHHSQASRHGRVVASFASRFGIPFQKCTFLFRRLRQECRGTQEELRTPCDVEKHRPEEKGDFERLPSGVKAEAPGSLGLLVQFQAPQAAKLRAECAATEEHMRSMNARVRRAGAQVAQFAECSTANHELSKLHARTRGDARLSVFRNVVRIPEKRSSLASSRFEKRNYLHAVSLPENQQDYSDRG